jgi:hypothetical protein
MSIRSGALGENFSTELRQGVLRLPTGKWRITASLATYLGGCPPSGDVRTVSAFIDVEVGSATGSTIELRTRSGRSELCPLATGTGRLALDPRSGLGIEQPGGTTTPVMWPFGYTAREEPGGAVLVTPTGNVVASEGQMVSWTGGAMRDGWLFACALVGLVDG